MNQKGLVPILIIILVAAAVLGGYFIYQNQPKPTPPPQPKTLINPEDYSNPPASTYISESIPSAETANWKTYANTQFKFLIKYPLDFLVNDKAAKNTITIEKEYQSQKEAPGYPSFMYISLIPDDFKGKAGEIYVYDPEEARMLLNMQIGGTDQDQRYTRLADLIIDGVNAKVFENLVPPRGSDKRRLYFHKGSNTYMIGLVTSSEDKSMTLETFNQILSTFKFTQ